MPFKFIKLYFFPDVCQPYIKFSDLFPETLILIWPESIHEILLLFLYMSSKSSYEHVHPPSLARAFSTHTFKEEM